MIRLQIKPLSINKAWQGRRYKTKDYKNYEQLVNYMLPPTIALPDGELKIYIEFGMNRSMDWDNPVKPFIDILQKKYLFNDNRIYEANVKKVTVPRDKEYINFKIDSL